MRSVALFILLLFLAIGVAIALIPVLLFIAKVLLVLLFAVIVFNFIFSKLS